ncbi:hypothetical protein BDZ94DRAFT_1263909, partial [Collybia nuda]
MRCYCPFCPLGHVLPHLAAASATTPTPPDRPSANTNSGDPTYTHTHPVRTDTGSRHRTSHLYRNYDSDDGSPF